MPLQFTVRDASGNVQLDLTNSTTKFVGEIAVSSTGSLYVPQLQGRRAWAVFVPNGWQPLSIWAGRAWVDGATVNWQLTRGNYVVRYGVY
jgi:hypothetical protein